MKEKTKIEINGEKKNLYSSRQISQILDCISEKHYKNEIIHEITREYHIKNIIILDESAKLNLKYKNLNDEEFKIDSSSLLDLYHKGKPFSIIVDKKIMLMKLSFEIFEELFHHYRENKKKMDLETKRELLFELYEIVTSEKYSEEEIVSYFKRYSEYRVDKINLIKSKIQNISTLYDKYKKLSSMNISKKNSNEYKDVKRIQKAFFNYFTRLSKPLVYIQLDNNMWKMMGVGMIQEDCFKHSNAQFLDVNKVQQNSPLIIILSVSSLFLPNLIKLSNDLIESNKKKKSNDDNLKKLESIIKSQETEYDNPDLKLEDIIEIENKLNKDIEEMPEELRNRVKEMNKIVVENNNVALKESNISIDKIEINESLSNGNDE